MNAVLLSVAVPLLFKIVYYLVPKQPFEMGIIWPFLQVRKLKLSEIT